MCPQPTHTDSVNFAGIRRELDLVDSSAKFFAALFEQAPDPMMVIDDSGRVHAANVAACRLHAVDRYALIGIRIQDLLPRKLDLADVAESLRDRGEASLEFTETTESGISTNTRVEARRFHPHRYVICFRDVTREKKLEGALERAHDQEAFCLAAAAIVHDVNNLLVPIVYYTNVLAARVPLDGDLVKMTGEMRAAAERAGAMARKLLSIARPAVETPTLVQMNEVIERMKDIIARIVGERIEVALRLDPELVRVKVDRDRLERLVLNLVLNARDAMSNGGKLTIDSANTTHAEELSSEQASARAGGRYYATITVSDTGPGMDAPTRKRIFEPFFTTKTSGAGSGVGLSSTLSFVHRNQGYVEVDSELGRGSSFRVGFPDATDAEQ